MKVSTTSLIIWQKDRLQRHVIDQAELYLNDLDSSALRMKNFNAIIQISDDITCYNYLQNTLIKRGSVDVIFSSFKKSISI